MTGFSYSPYRINKGFTLVELMVAMVLGAFFLNGLLQIFSSTKQTYRVQENLARLQENGRFAIDFISQDVRMAGYWGCGSKVPSITGLNAPSFFYMLEKNIPGKDKLEKTIEGFEATSASTWIPPLDPVFNQIWLDKVVEGSDVLVVRRVNAQGFSVLNHAPALANLQLDATSKQLAEAGITEGTVVIATDCTNAEAFQVTNKINPLEHKDIAATDETAKKAATPGNNLNNLLNTYRGGKVYAVNSVSYYVATNRNNEKLLYRRTNGAVKPDELQLVDGVEQMQVLYGVDTATDDDSSPNYYVKANLVNDWKNVVSVRISLLLATLDDNIAERSLPLPYPFNDASVNGENPIPTDRKIRRAFTSTIAIRNRLK
ncbi:Type IV pilus assembly protein PilW [Crenothrix polyspora]|uniref:Type IV pilus assembly protein PilW n=1 Tax=Crenothrix polyspora TaxID=360316 RepID=A0A1R4H1Q4_9GAMM|nr:PilW family protein [Crenothrix polyspora]SJM89759.1 Type IV pilus assembly protein PilW [Crenothrix polyspora]